MIERFGYTYVVYTENKDKVIGCFDNEKAAKKCLRHHKSKFWRFLGL